jgi:F-type H+-transporting ATPase subunit a
MPEQLWFTAVLNHLLAGLATPLLRTIGLPPDYPQAPVSNFVAMEFLVFVILITYFIFLRLSFSVERPGGFQHIAEVVEDFVQEQSTEIIGHHSEDFTPFLVTLGLFILVGNLMGVIPGFEAPTGSPSVPLGLAVLTFIYYHMHGIKKHGPFKYAKQFLGPLGMIGAVIMLPIELVSHAARLLSLTVRLWANMYAGDLVTLAFFSMIPVLLPVLFLGLHIFVAFLQAYIFVLLAIVYLSGAVADEH